MSSVRLTNAIRERIAANALVKSGVTAELKSLESQRHEVARDARIAAFGGADKVKEIDSNFSRLEKLDKEAREAGVQVYISGGRSSSIYLAIGGRRLGWCEYGYDSDGHSIELVTPNRDRCMFAAEHEISKRFDEIFSKEQKLQNRKSEIEIKVWAALNSVQTLKRLVEVWPESKELIPDDVESVKATLPSLKVEDLNKMIGLPTGDSEQAA